MDKEFYKYPVNFSRLIQNDNLEKCSLGESISQNLQLIIISHHGEHRYNPSLGCEIWDMDFDLIMSLKVWEEKLRRSLETAIYRNEIRIEKTDIEVKVSEIEKKTASDKYTVIKRKVDIFIKAKITETGEAYHFHTDLYLSPVSYN